MNKEVQKASMKTKRIAIIIASVVTTSVPTFAGTPKLTIIGAPQTTSSLPVGKPNFFCRIPVLKHTSLCNTYNVQMAQMLAPRGPFYIGK